MTIAYACAGDYSLQHSQIQGETVKICTGRASYEVSKASSLHGTSIGSLSIARDVI